MSIRGDDAFHGFEQGGARFQRAALGVVQQVSSGRSDDP
jgi:hypothetical protein